MTHNSTLLGNTTETTLMGVGTGAVLYAASTALEFGSVPTTHDIAWQTPLLITQRKIEDGDSGT